MSARAVRLAAIATLLLLIALVSTAMAANASVEIANFAFDPPTLAINAGDTVTWTNRDSAQHSAVFANGGPRTRALSSGQSDSVTFASAGTFNYVCGIHGASMSGTVIVRAAATAPPTIAPTPVPTLAPTLAPTAPPTANPSPTPSAPPTTAAPSATALPTAAVAVPTQQVPAPASSNDGGGPNGLLIGGAAFALIAVGLAILVRNRR
jgi:plastocyanin